jgi:AraC-like DNA-binding protein
MQDFNKSLGVSPTRGPIDIPFNEKGIDTWHNIYQTLEMGYSGENLCNASFCLHQLLATFFFPGRHIRPESDSEVDMITGSIMNMRDNLAQRLSVEEMAKPHRLSVSRFSFLFRQATGMPPLDYFIHLKMQKACQLLHVNNAKIITVAAIVGYDDPYYFSRMFKKYLGTSPEQYREMTKITGETMPDQ